MTSSSAMTGGAYLRECCGVAASTRRVCGVAPCREKSVARSVSGRRGSSRLRIPRIDGMAIGMKRNAFCVRSARRCVRRQQDSSAREAELGSATHTSKPGEVHGARPSTTASNDPHAAVSQGVRRSGRHVDAVADAAAAARRQLPEDGREARREDARRIRSPSRSPASCRSAVARRRSCRPRA